MTVASAACTVACYRGPLFGEFQPFGEGSNSNNLTVHDSILYRLWHALVYLDATNTLPHVNWGQFLQQNDTDKSSSSSSIASGGAGGNPGTRRKRVPLSPAVHAQAPALAWGSIAVAGHSLGADMAVFISKQFSVERAVALAGPNSYLGHWQSDGSPPSRGSVLHPAPWVSAGGKTAGWKLFMFGDLHGRSKSSNRESARKH